MHILKETALGQSLYIIPRSYPAEVDIIIQNDSTKVETTYTITTATDSQYLVLLETFVLEEDNFYTLIVKDSTDIIYVGRIFCTNQTDLEEYSINDGTYTEREHDNEYIIYE